MCVIFNITLISTLSTRTRYTDKKGVKRMSILCVYPIQWHLQQHSSEPNDWRIWKKKTYAHLVMSLGSCNPSRKILLNFYFAFVWLDFFFCFSFDLSISDVREWRLENGDSSNTRRNRKKRNWFRCEYHEHRLFVQNVRARSRLEWIIMKFKRIHNNDVLRMRMCAVRVNHGCVWAPRVLCQTPWHATNGKSKRKMKQKKNYRKLITSTLDSAEQEEKNRRTHRNHTAKHIYWYSQRPTSARSSGSLYGVAYARSLLNSRIVISVWFFFSFPTIYIHPRVFRLCHSLAATHADLRPPHDFKTQVARNMQCHNFHIFVGRYLIFF